VALDEGRLHHDVAEVLPDAHVAREELFGELLVVGHAAREELQQVVVAARNEVAFDALVEEVLGRNLNVEKYFSYVVMKSAFVKTYYPIEKLFASEE